MYPHLSIVAGLGGRSLALLVGAEGDGVDSEREKAKLILCLQQQVEALSQSKATLEEQRERIVKENTELEARIEDRKAQLVGKDEEVKVFNSKLAVAEDELILAKMRLELLKEEGAKRTSVYEAEKRRHEEALREERVDLKQRQLEKKRDDTENTLLLRLLNAEAEKWKHQTLELQSAVDVQVREEAKSNILLALVNAQLVTQREESSVLRKEVDTLKGTLQATEKQYYEADAKCMHLTFLLDRQKAADDKAKKDHYFKITRRKAHEGRQESVVESLEKELESYTTDIEEYKSRVGLRLKSSHGQQADLEAECMKLNSINNRLRSAIAETQEIEGARYCERSDEIEKLSIEREAVARKQELIQMKRFEESVANANTVELLTSQLGVLANKAKAFDESAIIKEAAIRDRIEAARAMAAAIKKEDDGSDFRSLKTVIASNECLRNQIVALQKRAAERNEVHIDERIVMAAEIAKNKARVADLEDQVKDMTLQHRNALSGLEEEKAKASSSGVGAEEVQRMVNNLKERCIMIERETETLAKHRQALEKEAERSGRFFDDKCVAYQAEAKTHKNEISRLVRIVSRLEAKVAETHEYRLKAEENKDLEEEFKKCKKEQRYMQNVISTMTVEKGLLDGYKAKVLAEQNETQLQKLKALQALKARHVPLLKELLATARKHDIKSDAIKNAERAALELGISCYHTPVPPTNLWSSQ